MDFELSITICSWNAKDDLRACLQSLWEVQNEAKFEVIIIENDSEDGSGDMVKSEFPEFRLEQQKINLGFCGGHNLGVALMQGKHWFCLNSDTVVHPGAIRTMLDYLDNHPDVAIVGPKLLNTDGTLQFSVRRFPNPVAALFRNTLLGKLFPNNKATKHYLMKELDHEHETEADWVSGAAFMMSRTALEKVGSFDPEYFMFCEDVDLCWRCHKNGFKVMYVPQAQITHHIGRSTDKVPNRMIGRFHKSMYKFYVKNQLAEVPKWKRPFLKMVAISGLSLRAGMFIAKNKLDRLRGR